ncbi:MAG: carbohydrate ABC transporter permease, partial [Firmicutes bacterium]|nr:carbohydrate ABC transporter permease [Bacillota bacterium]
IFPISLPGISTAAIISFLFIYNDLIFALMFLTQKTKQTISIGLMAFVGQRSTEIGPTFASIILSIVPMIVVYLLFQEKVEKGLTAGAVKG